MGASFCDGAVECELLNEWVREGSATFLKA